MTTMKDVAKKANVGIATVSRVINNSGFVSDSTREVVEKAIKELNYVPNELARNFQKSKTNIIGVIIPSIEHSFTNQLLSEIELELKNNGYLMMVGISDHSPTLENEYITKLSTQQVGGLIITAPVSNNYSEFGFPIVSFDRKISENIPYVYTDNYGGAEFATKQLIESGCKKLLLVHFDCDTKSLSNDRRKAFEALCKTNNTEYTSILYDKDEGVLNYIDRVVDIATSEKYDGIFFTCDYYARLFYNSYLKKYQTLPKDIKVIGFDGLESNEKFYPHLTTIGHDYHAIAEKLVSILFSQMNERVIEYEHCIDYKYIKGDTL